MSEVQINVVKAQDTQIVTAVAGIQGPVGLGFPSGGTEGDLIVKQSGTDYDAAWASSVSGFSFSSASISDSSITDSSIVNPTISGLASTGSGLTLADSGDTLSFFGSSPVVCPSGIVIPSGGSTADEVGAALSGVIVALESLGIIRL
jgi:hypothetical protein